MSDKLLEIGSIVGTHGLRGDLKVRPDSAPDTLLAVARLVVQRPSGQQEVCEVARRVVHKGRVLMRLSGHQTPERAAELVGSRVLVAESELPATAADEYYWKDLYGLRVIDRQYGDIGRLCDLFSSAAHDTYVVQGARGEVLIPAVRQFVERVDLEARTLYVSLPDGLVPDDS